MAKKQADTVYKIVEVVGVSEKSWEEAGRRAVETAAGSLRDLRQILALAQTAGRAVCQRTDQTLVARNNLPESLTVARNALAHQIRVTLG